MLGSGLPRWYLAHRSLQSLSFLSSIKLGSLSEPLEPQPFRASVSSRANSSSDGLRSALFSTTFSLGRDFDKPDVFDLLLGPGWSVAFRFREPEVEIAIGGIVAVYEVAGYLYRFGCALRFLKSWLAEK